MKLLPILLLQVVTAAATVVIYDHVRDDDSDASADGPLVAAVDTSSLERRLAALEAGRSPTLTATAPEADLVARIAALEQALDDTPLFVAPDEDVAEGSTAPPTIALGEPTWANRPVTSEEIQRFRKLREATRKQDALEKNRERIDRMLARADIQLSDRQREAVHEAYNAFRPRVDEIWVAAKDRARETIAGGGEIDRQAFVAETTEVIVQEFAGTLEGAVSSGEAESIAQALMSRGK